MRPLIDYLQFTFPYRETHFEGPDLERRHVMSLVYKELGKDLYIKVFPGLPDFFTPFPPYRYGLQSSESNATIQWHPKLEHYTIQLPGKACGILGEFGSWKDFLQRHGYRCRRIDISCDIETTVTPTEFCRDRSEGRWRYLATTESVTGQSVYIGSPDSSRRAVVYRYYPPHPRHKTLRVEHRFSGERAEQMVEYVCLHGIEGSLRACQDLFGWSSELYKVGEIDLNPIEALNVSAKHSGELVWVLKQVFPALKRYEREGKIDDLREFCETHLFETDGLEYDTPMQRRFAKIGDTRYYQAALGLYDDS